MSHGPSAPPPGEREQVSRRAGYVGLALFVALAVFVVVSVTRDPGLPAHVAQDYMRVAAGVVTPGGAVADAAVLQRWLRASGLDFDARVPDLSSQGFTLDGGRVHAIDDRRAALAIYHDRRRELVTWHAWTGRLDELPATPDERRLDGRWFAVHRKSTNALVFWQDGPLLQVVTSSLPAERVVQIALVAAGPAAPAQAPDPRQPR